jgi:hypothetical protein
MPVNRFENPAYRQDAGGRHRRNLRQTVTVLLDSEDADQIVDMMHCHQVQNARLGDVLNKLNNPEILTGTTRVLGRHNFEFTLQSTVELYLRAEALFSFASRECGNVELPPFAEERVQSALSKLHATDWLPNFEIDNIVSLMTNMSVTGRWRRSSAET